MKKLIKKSRVQDISVFEEIKEFIGSEDNPKFFFTMTEINKVGIKPGSFHGDTPFGVYGYPLTKETYDQLVSDSLPYAKGRPYINVFTTSVPLTNLGKYSEEDLRKDISTIMQMYLDFDDWKLNFYMQNSKACRNVAASNFWSLTEGISFQGGGSKILKWNSLLRNLGYVGLYDPGMKLIHVVEKTQAVILDPSIIITIKTILNPHGRVEEFANLGYSSSDPIDSKGLRNKQDLQIYKDKKRQGNKPIKPNLSDEKIVNIIEKTNNLQIIDSIIDSSSLTPEILDLIINKDIVNIPYKFGEKQIAKNSILIKILSNSNSSEDTVLKTLELMGDSINNLFSRELSQIFKSIKLNSKILQILASSAPNKFMSIIHLILQNKNLKDDDFLELFNIVDNQVLINNIKDNIVLGFIPSPYVLLKIISFTDEMFSLSQLYSAFRNFEDNKFSEVKSLLESKIQQYFNLENVINFIKENSSASYYALYFSSDLFKKDTMMHILNNIPRDLLSNYFGFKSFVTNLCRNKNADEEVLIKLTDMIIKDKSTLSSNIPMLSYIITSSNHITEGVVSKVKNHLTEIESHCVDKRQLSQLKSAIDKLEEYFEFIAPSLSSESDKKASFFQKINIFYKKAIKSLY